MGRAWLLTADMPDVTGIFSLDVSLVISNCFFNEISRHDCKIAISFSQIKGITKQFFIIDWIYEKT
jgi:hypothetical protein